ncbi:glycosyltransferase family 2 protein [Paracoccus sp. MBLB3053]|uniref:Glycosyltransferase family 2 protein n=1 Tax=Paracoccus aurantius TaxID=3073814 RepID=A0ABU2HVR0_9RHOB|nr:glycosyltransferase family 2 protein [Paracoccus sp. MBLB3053]MDS9469137.1 glycosyltransferase family 2 protein [Paracoccus sp. MBLB3053]
MTKVSILMAVYNGQRFLQEQLDSFVAQDGVDWSLTASDDGSTDGSADIIAAFAALHPGRVEQVQGPRNGVAENFRHLLSFVPTSADFAAFSDQDDVWLPGKLSRAVSMLEKVTDGRPALYCSRTRIVSCDLGQRGLSRDISRPPSFRNALVQNIASGNTIVLNRAAVDLLQAAHAEAGPVPIHDWWAYQIIAGAGGEIVFDREPALLYRQHGENSIGANAGLRSLRERVQMTMRGRFASWHRMNTAALSASSHRMTEANRQILTDFQNALNTPSTLRRLKALRQSGAYRQTWTSNAALWVAAIINRL